MPAAGPSQPHLHRAHDRATGTARQGCIARDRGVRVGMGFGWKHSGYIGKLRAGEIDQQDKHVLPDGVGHDTGGPLKKVPCTGLGGFLV